ncbi:uncharacterized protein LOC124631102 isoform X1 [Helicoverpa zea]|uniref:uncharacterized protein LOC124631102 isoform X1 n=1 Tax=Helicoverpa zea TaxID=7113 RepID=UPI001F56F788|nr:uncharacterized protein LOC124631102 isoform X1 [Helicoverpa zea]
MFSITTVLFIVYFLSDFSHGQRDKKFFRQDYTYLEAGDGFYRMQRLPRTWFKAKVMCAQEGSSLFFPESNAEAEAVLAFWQHWSDEIDRTLLGMSDLLVNGEFVTLNGKPASKVYNKWKPGEPNGLSGNEHCVNWQSDGLLNDCPCDYKDYFICKKSLESLEWNYLCNMPYMGKRTRDLWFSVLKNQFLTNRDFLIITTYVLSFSNVCLEWYEWLPIRRRVMRALTTLFSILYTPSSPSYLTSHFQYVCSQHNKNLRSSNNRLLHCPAHRSDIVHSSFFVKSILLWNELPLEIRMVNSRYTFKKKLRDHIHRKLAESLP